MKWVIKSTDDAELQSFGAMNEALAKWRGAGRPKSDHMELPWHRRLSRPTDSADKSRRQESRTSAAKREIGARSRKCVERSFGRSNQSAGWQAGQRACGPADEVLGCGHCLLVAFDATGSPTTTTTSPLHSVSQSVAFEHSSHVAINSGSCVTLQNSRLPVSQPGSQPAGQPPASRPVLIHGPLLPLFPSSPFAVIAKRKHVKKGRNVPSASRRRRHRHRHRPRSFHLR